MTISVQQKIDAPPERVWEIITDIDHAAQNISGIKELEVLERPSEGLAGLKWRETRVMFGKEADETMWISAVEPGRWYETTAHNHGMVYTSRMAVQDAGGASLLTMSFSARATTLGAKIMSLVSVFFNGALRKVIAQDLEDIRRVAEAS